MRVIRQRREPRRGGRAHRRPVRDHRARSCSRSTPTTSRSRAASARAADLLEANPDAVACIGDYEEFGNDAIVRAVPDVLDPYRIAFTNEYAITSLFRRTAVERRGGWRDPLPAHRGYEDWNLWMDLAERGERGGAPARRAVPPPPARARASICSRVSITPRSTARCAACTRGCSPTWPSIGAGARRSRAPAQGRLPAALRRAQAAQPGALDQAATRPRRGLDARAGSGIARR